MNKVSPHYTRNTRRYLAAIVVAHLVAVFLAFQFRAEWFPLFHWGLFTRSFDKGSYYSLRCLNREQSIHMSEVLSEFSAFEATLGYTWVQQFGKGNLTPSNQKLLKEMFFPEAKVGTCFLERIKFRLEGTKTHWKQTPVKESVL